MQSAEVVLGVLRERGRQGLPCAQLYRQMFNKDLYLLAYGNIYSNSGAMTPGASEETADGMSEEKIEQIIEAMRCERYRFAGPPHLHSEEKRECAMRRIVVSPVKRAEMRGDISGSDALPEFERTHGKIAWQKTGGRVQVSGTARREIRVILVKAILPES